MSDHGSLKSCQCHSVFPKRQHTDLRSEKLPDEENILFSVICVFQTVVIVVLCEVYNFTPHITVFLSFTLDVQLVLLKCLINTHQR